jgi:hypothetical protein
LLDGPLSGGVGGCGGEVQAAGAVFQEGHGVEALAERGVEVEEVCCDDALGLGGQELCPGGTLASGPAPQPTYSQTKPRLDSRPTQLTSRLCPKRSLGPENSFIASGAFRQLLLRQRRLLA